MEKDTRLMGKVLRFLGFNISQGSVGLPAFKRYNPGKHIIDFPCCDMLINLSSYQISYYMVAGSEQEAQLPQRDSASGSLTDRVIHCTEHRITVVRVRLLS